MKKIYYSDGPDSIKAGIAGMFRIGKYKLVPGWIAEQLLKKKDIFKEVGKKEEIPLDELADPAEFAGRETPPEKTVEAAAVPAEEPIAKEGGDNA